MLQLANTARTTLVDAIGAGDLSIELADPTRFPTVSSTILTGTITSSANPYVLTGTGTLFLTEVTAGDTILFSDGSMARAVLVVTDTSLVVDRPTSLAGVTAIAADAYYITVSSGGGLNREYMLVTATSGAVFTVRRAQDNSTAMAFAAGAAIQYRVTSGLLRQVVADAVTKALVELQAAHGADLIGVAAAGIVATTVRTALEELATAISTHIGSSPAHAAEDISFTPAAGIIATDVQAAIVELVSDAAAALTAHVVSGTAHDADQIVFSPYGGISATDMQAALEQLWDEIEAFVGETDKQQDVIDTSGQTFSPVDDTQLAKAVSIYVAGADYWTCTGSSSAFTLTAPGTMRKPVAYFEGMRVRFFANAANTGPSTIDVGGLGSKNVYDRGTSTAAYWRADELVELVYSGSAFYKFADKDGRVLYYQEYLSGSNTWNKPAGYAADDTVLIRTWGAGGGSGSGTSSRLGSGGGFNQRAVRFADCPASLTCVVGAASGDDGGDTEVYSGTDFGVGATGGYGSPTGYDASPVAGGYPKILIPTLGTWKLLDIPEYRGGSAINGSVTADANAVWGGAGYVRSGSDRARSVYGGDGGRSDVTAGAVPGGGGGDLDGGGAVSAGAGKIEIRIISGWFPDTMSNGFA